MDAGPVEHWGLLQWPRKQCNGEQQKKIIGHGLGKILTSWALCCVSKGEPV